MGSWLLWVARARVFKKTELQHSDIPVFPLLQTGWVPIPKWRLLSRKGNMVYSVVMFLSCNSESEKKVKLELAGIKSYQLDLGIECVAFADRYLKRRI